MEIVSPTDVLLLKALLASASFYAGRAAWSSLTSKSIEPLIKTGKKTRDAAQPYFAPTRSISKKLEQYDKQCIIFYGSQTGTAERLALALSKEGQVRFGLQSIVADLDEYDFDDLESMPSGTIAVFILATYGDGEPTDNAIAFEKYISNAKRKSKQMDCTACSTLSYAAFGLGSSSYPRYNAFVQKVDTALFSCGARRLGTVGIADDAKGSTEEDFGAWKDGTLKILGNHLGLVERPYVFEPTFDIHYSPQSSTSEAFLGEPNARHLHGRLKGPFSTTNPYPSQIKHARQLFASGSRQCLHIEFDLGNSALRYETGDHLSVRPINPDIEVDRFIRIFGLVDRKDDHLHITSCDPTIKVGVPSPTTVDSLARFYLDICGPVSRQFLSTLAAFATEENVRAKVVKLAADKVAFERDVTAKRLNLAQTLETLAGPAAWGKIPLSLLLESIGLLKPRYYSISSSSAVSRSTASITAVVESKPGETDYGDFKGVSSNYLLALSQSTYQDTTQAATHQIGGPGDKFTSPTALISVRRSKFWLPKRSSTPVIMIGPGTGVAPFRGFVQERAASAKLGLAVGKTILYYGCRRRSEDYVYGDEWEVRYWSPSQTLFHSQLTSTTQEMAESFPPSTFSLRVVFSREGSEQRYVQHLFRDDAAELRRLILEQNACVYVCGDAKRMAKDVFAAMAQVVAGHEKFSGDVAAATIYLDQLRKDRRWAEDVW